MSNPPDVTPSREKAELANRLIDDERGLGHEMEVRVYYEDTDFSDPPLL